MTTMLSARGLMKSFGAVTAADDVNIEVPSGQRVSLIGSNGAGKTTFVNMVTGYLKPDAGTIALDGREITGLGPRRITRLGVARSFQIPQLALDMTALDNMLVAAACNDGELSFWKPARSPGRRARAMALLERFDLAAHAQRKVSELPGGVRKLLDIAMALTGQPKLLLLDEPTSGVSVEEKFPMMDTIAGALAAEKVTVLFVEHDMEIVTRYADRVIAFYSGRVIADDPPDAVLADEQVQRYVTGSLRQGA
ncbi:ABC transporter ATP-binding protein [Zeimonas arvi]|uniref:ABC transporter ATP-binding protein n=1 Tax=Zeimonas arvi TaxID=2498847 RepID=A0A5C8P4W9_9BURK|nr:ABC transporter ATP-binding protein [Zeimonas arvi]TXL68275.1 ABC transporter ATP-binding protein [Zeimonas arvi]